MVYITVKASPRYHQMTLEELLFGTWNGSVCITKNETNTRTYCAPEVPYRLYDPFKWQRLKDRLQAFNIEHEALRQADRASLYDTFFIPKKSGGWRRIDAPKRELMDALRQLKKIFEEDFHALYHTAAFAYIKGRSTIDAVKKHQSNESRWFAKLDLHDFFGSTTPEFVMQQLSMIYPFSEVIRTGGSETLRTALDLAFLNGGLPQGTPISPLITNLMMIPVDHALANAFHSFSGPGGNQRFVYTRYADDFLISSRYDFNIRAVEKLVTDTLKGFYAPFSINEKKTRYGSSAGSNWNLGVMLNKDNQITVGYKKKRQFKSMLFNYGMDKKNGKQWQLDEIQYVLGLYSYYKMVEPTRIDEIVGQVSDKVGVWILTAMKQDIKALTGADGPTVSAAPARPVVVDAEEGVIPW